MTIKELCNLEDLYNLFRDDFEAICREQPNTNNEDFDFDDYDNWYQRFIIAQAKWVTLDELVERLGYRFYEYDNGFRLEEWD